MKTTSNIIRRAATTLLLALLMLATAPQTSWAQTAETLGGYTFTMPASDVTVSAAFTLDPAHFADNGDDTYTIKTAEGWNVFCNLLKNGETFLNKTVYLGASITVSRMAGDGEHGFAGTFDGQNNTLTFNYGTAESPADEQFVAPFSFTVSGTSPVFRDLRRTHRPPLRHGHHLQLRQQRPHHHHRRRRCRRLRGALRAQRQVHQLQEQRRRHQRRRQQQRFRGLEPFI